MRVGHVDGQAEADVRELFDGGLAALEGVAHVEVGHLAQRLHQRVADEVREGDLAADGARQVGVDEGPVFDEELGGDLALGGGRRDGQRGLHVLGGRAGGGLQDAELVLGGSALEEREGRAPVLLARVGAGGLGERGGRGGRQVGARDGDDVRGLLRCGLSVLFDVEGRRRDRCGDRVIGGGRGLGVLAGRGRLGRRGSALGDVGTLGAQLRGSGLGGEIGTPGGIQELGITVVEVSHLRDVPLRIGLGSGGSGHVFLRKCRAARMGQFPRGHTSAILPPRDRLHETWYNFGVFFKGLWSVIGRVLAQLPLCGDAHARSAAQER